MLLRFVCIRLHARPLFTNFAISTCSRPRWSSLSLILHLRVNTQPPYLHPTFFLRVLHRKTLEVVGLRLTPVQHVYWKAVQRRMVLGQLQELVESVDRSDGDMSGLRPIPPELLRALTKSDKGR